MTARLPGERDIISIADGTWAEEVFLAQETQRAALDLLDRGRMSTWEKGDAIGVAVLVGLLAKAIKTGRAAVLLAEHGLIVDAEGLYRTLLLTLAVVRWICHHPDDAHKRAARYVDICLAQQYRFRNAARSSPALRSVVAGELGQHLENLVSALVDRHGLQEVARLADECPWKSDAYLTMHTSLSVPYDIFYRRASQILHAQDITEHVDPFPESGSVIVRPFPTDVWGPEVILLTCQTLLVLLSELNRSLDCEMDDTLDVLRQRAEEMQVKRQKARGA